MRRPPPNCSRRWSAPNRWFEAFNEQDFIEEFSAPRADLERGSLGMFEEDRLVAVGWLLVTRTAAQWEASLQGGVHPDYTGCGLGGASCRSCCSGLFRSATAMPSGCPGC